MHVAHKESHKPAKRVEGGSTYLPTQPLQLCFQTGSYPWKDSLDPWVEPLKPCPISKVRTEGNSVRSSAYSVNWQELVLHTALWTGAGGEGGLEWHERT